MRQHKFIRAAALLGAALFGLASPLGGAQASNHVVNYHTTYDSGTVVISMSQRKLYLVLGDGRAIQYPVAVAKPGKEWFGATAIRGKHMHPDWTPPAVVKRDHPRLPDLIKGGSPKNPMGVAAMTLERSEIAIHGTANWMRSSIGSRASYGCIRMLNEDVADLYERVSVGTEVVMVP
jgi:lipoprotein-anchoring transpeptidase ErfK/SrfK